jgi:hypothetical protein
MRVGGVIQAFFTVYKLASDQPAIKFSCSQVELLQEMACIAAELMPRVSPVELELPLLQSVVTSLIHILSPIEVAQIVTHQLWSEASRLLDMCPPPNDLPLYPWKSISRKFEKALLKENFSFLEHNDGANYEDRLQSIVVGILRLKDIFSTVHEIFENVLMVNLLTLNLVSFRSQSKIIHLHELNSHMQNMMHTICNFFSMSYSPADPVILIDASFPSNPVCPFCSPLLWVALYSLLLRSRKLFDSVQISANLLFCSNRSRSRSFDFSEETGTSRRDYFSRAWENPREPSDDLHSAPMYENNDEAVLQIQLSLSSVAQSPFSPTAPQFEDSCDYFSKLMDTLSEFQVYYIEHPSDATNQKICKICEISMILPYAERRSLIRTPSYMRRAHSSRAYEMSHGWTRSTSGSSSGSGRVARESPELFSSFSGDAGRMLPSESHSC